MKRYKWLDHLMDVIPVKAHGDRLSMYSVGLEGWRRGLTLKFYNNVKSSTKTIVNYTLSDGEKVHYFAVAKGDKVKKEIGKITESKGLTKKYLKEANVPIPEGVVFKGDTDVSKIIKYAEKIGYPVVLKPLSGSQGKGVYPNITSSKMLAEKVNHVRNVLKYNMVIVEKFIEGEEHRIYVLDGKVLAATNRVPANVIGDGINNIRELIKNKNIERKNNPNLSNRPIKITDDLTEWLKKEGLTLKSVPKKGERIFLSNKSNISSGGDPVDVTDLLTPKMKEVAVNAAKAIGSVQCGIDMIINKENNTCAVIELNSKPGIGAHLFPMEGIGRDIPKDIIDYYFPGTKRSDHNTFLYYDFDNILTILRSGSMSEIQVPAFPQYKLIIKGFILSGKVQGVGYRKWLQKLAVHRGLHGYAENKLNGKLEIVVAGSEEGIEDFVRIINEEKPNKALVESVNEFTVDPRPLKVGFEKLSEELTEGSTIKIRKTEKEKIESLNKQNEELKEEVEKLKKQLDTIKSSNSWKISLKINKVTKKFIKSK